MARADGIATRHMVYETAMALSQFVDEPASLLIAVRRLVDRQPHSGPLVWLAAHALGAPEPGRALWDAVQAVEQDQTADRLIQGLGAKDASPAGPGGFVVAVGDGPAEALATADGPWGADRLEGFERPAEIVGLVTDATHVIVEIDAMGAHCGLVSAVGLLAAATAQTCGTAVWGFAPTGVALPQRMYDGLTQRWRSSVEVGVGMGTDDGRAEIALDRFDTIVSPQGRATALETIQNSACPIVPELQ